MSDVSQWDTTASNNNSSPPDGAPEGMSPASINDVIRENMAALAREYTDRKGTITTGGTTTAYTLTTTNTHAALTDIALFAFQVNAANTGAATLAVDGLTAKSMQLNGAALAAGDLRTNEIVLALYNPDNDVFDIFKSGLNQDTIKTDTINEQTSDSGVTVDSVLLKDGGITLATGPAVNAVLDEDAMGSDSATSLATQQSIKAYVDNTVFNVGAISSSGTQVANDFARWSTNSTLEGRSYAEVKADLNLEIGTDVQEEISGATLTSATVATGDKVLIQDADDSDNLKTVTAQSIADLVAQDGIAKVWIVANVSGTILDSYNVTSITDGGAGIITVTIATDFSDADYTIVTNGSGFNGSLTNTAVATADRAAGSFIAKNYKTDSSNDDPQGDWMFACFGAQ